MRSTQYEAIHFNQFKHERILLRPMYYQLGFSTVPDIYGRRIILEKLLVALSFLPEQYGLMIWDVYRPRAVQKKLFEWMYQQIKKHYPALSNEETLSETKKYMSLPSAVGDSYCPPHLSGGAIDLTLFDLNTKLEIDMGTAFDDFTERAHRDYFENQSVLSEDEKIIQKNRKFLRYAMESAGLTSYQYEWWHYDFGNIFWQQATGKSAIFDPLFGDLEWPTEDIRF